MLLDKHSNFPWRDVKPVAGLHRQAIELIPAELGVKEAAVRAGEFEPYHRA